MKTIKSVICLLIVVLSYTMGSAQGNNPYGDNRGNKSINTRRFNRQCTEPFPMRSFNRDYAGMSNTNYYHLDKELKEYSRLHCLTSEQVRRLSLLFPTDREKYDYLTYALTYVFDIENYSLAGSVLANRNARDAFYRFLVREGVPAGDYYADPYAQGGYYANNAVVIPTTPQYYDRYGNRYNNNNERNNYDSRNEYDNYNNRPNEQPYDNRDYAQGIGLNSGYNGLLTYKEFEVIRTRIAQNTFDKGKLESAKQLTRENRLTANQIAEISRLFNYDSNRLEYAKYAFDYSYDRENYVVVTEAMAFEVNKKDLMRYVESRKR